MKITEMMMKMTIVNETNKKPALGRGPRRAGALALPLAALLACPAGAIARDIAIPSYVHCEAYNGRNSEPAFTVPLSLSLSAGKLHAIRYTQRYPGMETYDGSVAGDGIVRLFGAGAYNGHGRPWFMRFEGRLVNGGDTVLRGELRVPQTDIRKACTISWATALGDRTRPNNAIATKPAGTVATPVATPSLTSPTPTPSPNASSTTIVVAAVASSATHVVTSENAAAVNKRIADLKAQMDVLSAVLSEQTDLQKTATADLRASIDKAVEAVNARLEMLRSEYSAIDSSFGVYLTSVTPNDRDLYLTARKASEIYPKIPYYIPGTNETGEFWVEPGVSDRGELRFGFKFVDANASVETVRETIDMSLSEIEDAQKALFKLQAWSELAHQQKLRKAYEKRVTCFPVSECLPDGERVDGKAATEIRFNVYEDGSTAGSIQRDKGRFVESYNVSIESAMLLQAYLAHVIKVATREFDSGTQDKKALDQMFR